MKILAFVVGLLAPVTLAILMGGGPNGVSLAAFSQNNGSSNFDQNVVQTAALPGEAGAHATAPSAGATKPDQPPPIDVAGATRAWEEWTVRNELTAHAMALGAQGQILSSAGAQRRPDAAYPVAGLSRAITAMCLNDILPETGFTWSATLGQLSPALSAMNMTPHAGVQDLTLASLANHTAGFLGDFSGKNKTGSGRNLFTQQHFAREALTNPARQPAKPGYLHSNVNYAVLGQIIIALTGAPYEEICAQRIMAVAGASDAVVGGRMWATGSFGGWSASAEDYARFAMHWFHAERPWVKDPENYPLEAKVGAGLGVFHSQQRDGIAVHTTGLWRDRDPSRQHGAIVIISDTGAVFVANWQGDLHRKAYAELRQMIAPHLR